MINLLHNIHGARFNPYFAKICVITDVHQIQLLEHVYNYVVVCICRYVHGYPAAIVFEQTRAVVNFG